MLFAEVVIVALVFGALAALASAFFPFGVLGRLIGIW